MIFKYSELRNYFAEIKKHGKTELFKDWKGDNVFLIRHDIDFDLKLAHQVAAIEQEMNVVATFFILTSCHSYNVLSSRNRDILKKISDMGHEIGLHFDPTLYPENLNENFNKEVEILSFATGEQIRSVSLHNPSIHGSYPLFENYINAYDPDFFSNENYLSDSRFSFRGKDPYQFIKGVEHQMIQILLHPMHYSMDGNGYDQVFVDTFVNYMNDVHENFLINSTYVEQVGNDFIRLLKNRLG